MRALRSALALVLLSGLAGCAAGGYGYPSYGSSYGSPGYYAEPSYGVAYGPSVGFAYGGGYPVYYGGYPNYYHGGYPYWQQPRWRDWHDNDWHNNNWHSNNWNNNQWNNGQRNNWQGNQGQWANQGGTHNVQNPLYTPRNNLNSRNDVPASATNQRTLVGRQPLCRECGD